MARGIDACFQAYIECWEFNQGHYCDAQSIPDRVKYRLCVTVYKCLYGIAPQYLSDLCTPVAEVAYLVINVFAWLIVDSCRHLGIG